MKVRTFAFCVFFILTLGVFGQNTIKLSLKRAIELSNDSSISAFKAENLFLASYWDYKNYIAENLPLINLNISPLVYNRSISREFNPVDTTYSYFNQQNLGTYAGIELTQNIALTGGKLYVKSDLGRFQNFGAQSRTQFTSTPVRVGLNQPLFGFNSFKWEKKIAPLKYEIAKKQLVVSYEHNALKVVDYFFNYAVAEQNYKIAEINYHNADTLYNIGKKRFDLSTITKTDLLNLSLEMYNSRDQLSIAKNYLNRARALLLSALSLDSDIIPEIILPEKLPNLKIDPYKALEFCKMNNPDMLNFKQQDLETLKTVDEAKKATRFTANLDASYGINQTSLQFADVYNHPLQQNGVNVTLAVPIVDWGLRRGRYNLALKNREAVLAGFKQSIIDFEQEVLMTVSEFNIQSDLVSSSKQASLFANEAYEMSKAKFLLSQIDVNTLIIQLNRKDASLRAYTEALAKFWKYYYSIRSLTLYDFEKNQTIDYDFNANNLLND